MRSRRSTFQMGAGVLHRTRSPAARVIRSFAPDRYGAQGSQLVAISTTRVSSTPIELDPLGEERRDGSANTGRTPLGGRLAALGHAFSGLLGAPTCLAILGLMERENVITDLRLRGAQIEAACRPWPSGIPPSRTYKAADCSGVSIWRLRPTPRPLPSGRELRGRLRRALPRPTVARLPGRGRALEQRRDARPAAKHRRRGDRGPADAAACRSDCGG